MDTWKKGTTNCPELMALVHILYLCAAQYNIHILVTHLAGTDNSIADALSRFQVHRFCQLAPGAATNPDTICAWLIQLLRDSSATTSLKEWLSLPTEHIKLESEPSNAFVHFMQLLLFQPHHSPYATFAAIRQTRYHIRPSRYS